MLSSLGSSSTTSAMSDPFARCIEELTNRHQLSMAAPHPAPTAVLRGFLKCAEPATVPVIPTYSESANTKPLPTVMSILPCSYVEIAQPATQLRPDAVSTPVVSQSRSNEHSAEGFARSYSNPPSACLAPLPCPTMNPTKLAPAAPAARRTSKTKIAPTASGSE